MTQGTSVFDRYGAWMLVAMNLVWGASYIVADIALRTMSPTGLAAWRFLLTTALMFPILLIRGRRVRLERRDWLPVAAIGAVAVAGTYFLTYRGIVLASSTDRALVSPLEPVALALLGAVILRERLRGRQWVGIAVACTGAFLLAAREGLGTWHSGKVLGQSLMLLSFLTEGMYSIIGKPLLGRYRPLTLTVWSMLFATVFLFAGTLLEGGLPPPPGSPVAWAAVLFLVIPCSLVGYTLWYLVLEHKPAGEVGVFVFLQPLVGLSLGMAFRGERLGPMLAAGTLLVIAGVYLTGSTRAADPVPDPEPSA